MSELPITNQYENLQQFLGEQKWKDADQITTQILLAVAQREKQKYLDDEAVENLSCEDLCIIDNLWLTYSNHKFGFSVQLSVYKELVATGRYNSNMKLLTAFDSRLDWDRGGVLRFVEGYPDGILYNISARKGHL
ncbi:MAG: GUN4 domain-containing protein, partial [Dolichospermum sp.]